MKRQNAGLKLAYVLPLILNNLSDSVDEFNNIPCFNAHITLLANLTEYAA